MRRSVSFPRAPHAVGEPQLGVDPGAAVGAVAALVSLLNQLAEVSILNGALRRFPVALGVVAAPLRPAGRGA
jgi:hypothetical protein